MKTWKPWHVCAVLALSGCGGGGGGGGDTDTADANVLPAFEAAAVANSYYSMTGRFPASGQTAVEGTDHFHRTRFNWVMSPANGLQSTRPQVENLASTVGLLPAAQQGFQRQLVNGVIRTRSAGDRTTVQWLNGRLTFSNYASDQTTLMGSDAIVTWSFPIPLSGTLAASPDELRAAMPVLTRTAHTLFDLSRSWQPGSAYIKRQRVSVTDDLQVFDWNGVATYTDSPSSFDGPATTIEGLFALFPAGNLINGRSTQLADGDIQSIQGVRTWLLRTPFPSSSRPTVTYQAFFELGGKLYGGEYVRSGTPERAISELDGTVLIDYSVRWNLAATESIRSALNY